MDKETLEHREKKRRQVRNLLATGKKFTAIQINQEVNSADAHKMISVLRRQGLNIKDMIINKKTGTKVYWLEQKAEKQMSIFDVIGE